MHILQAHKGLPKISHVEGALMEVVYPLIDGRCSHNASFYAIFKFL